jgi:pimeloyl-ACP methyl ester carboxylesterase
VVVVHGLGSARAHHADFAVRVRAAGMGALLLDLRGHGESGGAPDRGCLDDVMTALDWLAARGAGPLGLRGSSFGGFLALHAAARHSAVRAVVAICAADPEGLAVRRGMTWAREMPLGPVVARDDGVARGYWHATGDEVVPWARSMALAQASPQPRALRIVLGGHHRSLQHDPDVQAATVAFLADWLRRPG